MSQLIKKSQAIAYSKENKYGSIDGYEIEKYGLIGRFYQGLLFKTSSESILTRYFGWFPLVWPLLTRVCKGYQLILPFTLTTHELHQMFTTFRDKGFILDTNQNFILLESSNSSSEIEISKEISGELQGLLARYYKEISISRKSGKLHKPEKDYYGNDNPLHHSLTITSRMKPDWDRSNSLDKYHGKTAIDGCADEDDELNLLDDVITHEIIVQKLGLFWDIDKDATMKRLSELTSGLYR